MAQRAELLWVQFVVPSRVDLQAGNQPAVAKSGTTSLYKGEWEGVPVVFIEDPSLPQPAIIPWQNIAAFGPVPEAVEPAKRGSGRPAKDVAA